MPRPTNAIIHAVRLRFKADAQCAPLQNKTKHNENRVVKVGRDAHIPPSGQTARKNVFSILKFFSQKGKQFSVFPFVRRDVGIPPYMEKMSQNENRVVKLSKQDGRGRIVNMK
jgi:hypothetical protein